MSASWQTRVEVHAALERVLHAEGIPQPEPQPSALVRWLSEHLGGLASAPLLAVLKTVALVLLGLVLLVWISRLVSRRRVRARGSAGALALDSRRARAAALRAAAVRSHASGELALALRQQLTALVVGLGEHGQLDYRPAWTLRELVARGRPPLALAGALEQLIDEVEPLCFARVEVREADYQRVARFVDQKLAEAP